MFWKRCSRETKGAQPGGASGGLEKQEDQAVETREEEGAMKAENPFAVPRALSCAQIPGMQRCALIPVPEISRTCRQGPAAADSAVKARSKATISVGMGCRGQIKICIALRVRFSGSGEGPPLRQGEARCLDSTVGHQAGCSLHKHIKADPRPNQCSWGVAGVCP